MLDPGRFPHERRLAVPRLPPVRKIAWCLVLVAALAVAGNAQADADPASDVLYQRDLFVPYSGISPAVEAELLAAIQKAKAAGKPIRVALIASRDDLGGVPQLFGNPLYYARFLDSELQFVYTGRLLVVMPQGAALAKGGRLLADKAVIAAKPPGPSGDDLARTATRLVEAISTGKEAPVSTVPQPALTVPAVTAPRTHTVATAPKKKGVPIGIATGIAIGIVAVILAIGGVILARRGRRAEL
jgi:hypothetical protein